MRSDPHSTWTPPVAGSSLSDTVRSLFGSVVAYLETRTRLLKLEASQAMKSSLRSLLMALFALTCFFVAYVSGMVAVTLWIAGQWWSGHVMPAAWIVCGIHLLLGILLMAGVYWSGRGSSFFEQTRKEFEEDKRWLHLQTEPSRN